MKERLQHYLIKLLEHDGSDLPFECRFRSLYEDLFRSSSGKEKAPEQFFNLKSQDSVE